MSFVSEAISRRESAACCTSRPPWPGASTIQAAAFGTGGGAAGAPWTANEQDEQGDGRDDARGATIVTPDEPWPTGRAQSARDDVAPGARTAAVAARRRRDGAARRLGALGRDRRALAGRHVLRLLARDLRRVAHARRRPRPRHRRQRRVRRRASCSTCVARPWPLAWLRASYIRGLCHEGRPSAAHLDVGRTARVARRARRHAAGVRHRRAGEGRPGRARRAAAADRARVHALRRLRDRGRRAGACGRRSAPACTSCCGALRPRSASRPCGSCFSFALAGALGPSFDNGATPARPDRAARAHRSARIRARRLPAHALPRDAAAAEPADVG